MEGICLLYYDMGWVGVGQQRRCKTHLSLHELDNQGTVFLFPLFWGSRWLSIELLIDHLGGVENRNCAQGELSYARYMVRHRRQIHSIPLLPMKAAALENESIHSQLSSRCKSASKAVLSRTRLTRHATRPTPHGASRLVQAMCAWSVKTRRAPSHCWDAKGYGHTTTAMHDVKYPPPLLLHTGYQVYIFLGFPSSSAGSIAPSLGSQSSLLNNALFYYLPVSLFSSSLFLEDPYVFLSLFCGLCVSHTSIVSTNIYRKHNTAQHSSINPARNTERITCQKRTRQRK